MAQGLVHRGRGGAEAGLGVTLSPTLLLDVVIGGFTTGGIYALVALGLNLQYGLMRVLNVAHGEFLMLGAYVTFSLHTGWGVNPLLTLLITGPTAFAVGLVLHRLLYAPLLAGEAAESLESRSLLLSFGLMFVLQNAALLIWSADLRGYSYLAIPLRWLGTVFPANRVLAAAIALALGVAFYLYLRYSLTGKAVRALMQEPEGAQLMGIQTSRIHGLCFGAGIAMSAVTGSLVSMLFELTPFMGLPYTVTALVVVILGGLGNMLGCLMAGLLLGLVETAGRLPRVLRHPADLVLRGALADPGPQALGPLWPLRSPAPPSARRCSSRRTSCPRTIARSRSPSWPTWPSRSRGPSSPGPRAISRSPPAPSSAPAPTPPRW